MTADNATNMDTLSEYLAQKVLSYSMVNQTCCFLHILNLVAKSLLRQFDVTPRKETDGVDDDLSPEEEELLDLAEGLDKEELTMELQDDANEDEEAPEDDDDDGWVNKLSEEECDALKVHIRPVSCVLIKVRLLKLYIPC